MKVYSGSLWVLAVCLVYLAQPGEGGQKTENAAARVVAPKIEFGNTVFDFGKIMGGEVVKHDFVFTNTGSATLEILDVKPGCGCTTAGNWDKKVEPGKTGKIPLQLNSGSFSGTVTKLTTVTSSDPVASNVVLQLTGTIWKAIEITPPMAVFNLSSETRESETKVLRIQNHLSEPVTLSDLVCTNESFHAQLKTVEPGKEFELRITVGPVLSSPSVSGTILLKTSSSQMPVLTANVFAMREPAVAVTPAQIALGAGPLAADVVSVITIRNNGTNVLGLSDARVDAPGVEVRMNEPEHGRAFTLEVSFPAGFKLPAGKNGELTVRSTHPEFPVIKVPIFHAPTASPVAAQR